MTKFQRKFLLLFGACIGISYADCTFSVINDSMIPVTVEAGYFKADKTKATFTIQSGSLREVTIKNDFKCNETNQAGLGMTYINLVGDTSIGGWVFDPVNDQLKANGMSSTDDGATGQTATGKTVFLANTSGTSPDHFIVRIKTVKSTARQNASMH